MKRPRQSTALVQSGDSQNVDGSLGCYDEACPISFRAKNVKLAKATLQV